MTSGKESQKKLRERFLFERTESDKETERERSIGREGTTESDYEKGQLKNFCQLTTRGSFKFVPLHVLKINKLLENYKKR